MVQDCTSIQTLSYTFNKILSMNAIAYRLDNNSNTRVWIANIYGINNSTIYIGWYGMGTSDRTNHVTWQVLGY